MYKMKVIVKETKVDKKIEEEDKKYFSTASITINPNLVNPDEDKVNKFREAVEYFFSSEIIPYFIVNKNDVEALEINYQVEVGNKYSRTHIQAAMNIMHKYKTVIKFKLKEINEYWNNVMKNYINEEEENKCYIRLKMATDYARFLNQYVAKK